MPNLSYINKLHIHIQRVRWIL